MFVYYNNNIVIKSAMSYNGNKAALGEEYINFMKKINKISQRIRKSERNNLFNNKIPARSNTRWLYVLRQLRAIKDNYKSLLLILLSMSYTKKDKEKSKDLLNWDKRWLTGLIEVLQLFEKVVMDWQSTRYPNIQTVVPHVLHLKRKLKIIKKGKKRDNEIKKIIKNVFREALKDIFVAGYVNINMMVATRLLPCFKKLDFQYHLGILYTTLHLY